MKVSSEPELGDPPPKSQRRRRDGISGAEIVRAIVELDPTDGPPPDRFADSIRLMPAGIAANRDRSGS